MWEVICDCLGSLRRRASAIRVASATMLASTFALLPALAITLFSETETCILQGAENQEGCTIVRVWSTPGNDLGAGPAGAHSNSSKQASVFGKIEVTLVKRRFHCVAVRLVRALVGKHNTDVFTEAFLQLTKGDIPSIYPQERWNSSSPGTCASARLDFGRGHRVVQMVCVVPIKVMNGKDRGPGYDLLDLCHVEIDVSE